LNHFLKEGGFVSSPLFACNLELRESGETMARVLGIGGSHYRQGADPTHFIAPLGDFLQDVESFRIFCVIIEPHGVRRWREIIERMRLRNPLKWMLVRHPYEVARSFYNYRSSIASAHENPLALHSRSLADYVASREISDSWLIRNLLDLPDSTALSEEEILRAQETLSDFKIKDISLALSLLDSIFSECYGISSADISARAREFVRMNASDGAKVHLYDLPGGVQKEFLKRTQADLRLYGWAVDSER
jgi:hypothetical protein